MRRTAATVLLVLFSFSLIPAALFARADSKLPACCRRDGKHGCSKKSTMAVHEEPSGSAIKASVQCQFFLKGGLAPGAEKTAISHPVPVAVALVLDSLRPAELAETQSRVSFDRGWPKRGPPSLLS